MKKAMILILFGILSGCNTGSDDGEDVDNTQVINSSDTRNITVSVDKNVPITGSRIVSNMEEVPASVSGSKLTVVNTPSVPTSPRNLLYLVNSSDEVVLMGYEDDQNVLDAESTVDALLYLVLGGSAKVQNTFLFYDISTLQAPDGSQLDSVPIRQDVINNIKNSAGYSELVQLVSGQAATGTALATNDEIFTKLKQLIVDEATARYRPAISQSAFAKIYPAAPNLQAKTSTISINLDTDYTPLTKLPITLFGNEAVPFLGTRLTVTELGVNVANFKNNSSMYWHITTNQGQDVMLPPANFILGTSLFGGIGSEASLTVFDPDSTIGTIGQDKKSLERNVLGFVFDAVNGLISIGLSKGEGLDPQYMDCINEGVGIVFNRGKLDELVDTPKPNLLTIIAKQDWSAMVSPAISCMKTKLSKKLFAALVSKTVLKYSLYAVPVFGQIIKGDELVRYVNIASDYSQHYSDSYILMPNPNITCIRNCE